MYNNCFLSLHILLCGFAGYNQKPTDIAAQFLSILNKKPDLSGRQIRLLHGDPYGTRTHVTAVKGRCLNHLTNGPGSGNLTRTDDNTGMNRVLYQLSYAAIF